MRLACAWCALSALFWRKFRAKASLTVTLCRLSLSREGLQERNKLVLSTCLEVCFTAGHTSYDDVHAFFQQMMVVSR